MQFAQQFVLLDLKQHDVKGFDCGKEDMNLFLSRYADKNRKLGLSSSWVLSTINQETGKSPIAAYYTLASCTVSREQISVVQSLPAYPVPVVLLARLAVDLRFQKRGLGAKTLVSALWQAVFLTERGLPAIGVILDVLDEEALQFYQGFEIFHAFTDNPMRLFVPMHVLKQL